MRKQAIEHTRLLALSLLTTKPPASLQHRFAHRLINGHLHRKFPFACSLSALPAYFHKSFGTHPVLIFFNKQF